MSGNKPIRRSLARVEFLACLEDAEGLLKQGYSKQIAYEKLKEQGAISMAYGTFCKFITRAAKNELEVASLRPAAKQAPPPAPKPPVSRPTQPNIIKAKPDGLQDPRTVDPSSVI